MSATAEAVANSVTETAAPPAAAPRKSRKGLVIAILVLLAAIGGGAAWYFLLRPAPAAPAEGATTETTPKSKSPAQYLPLQPAFVVNLADAEAARYLQVEMELMARSGSALDEAKDHMPRIRNSLLLLLGSRRAADIADRAGKEKLQADVLTEVQKVLSEETGKPLVEAVYFNSFVMQ